jgi:chemotaxis protein methyltransferase CheR
VTPLDYDFVREALKQRSGLTLGADKHFFLESRLLPLARQKGFAGVGDLVLALKSGGDAGLVTEVVEAMMTNESSSRDQWRPLNGVSIKQKPRPGPGF